MPFRKGEAMDFQRPYIEDPVPGDENDPEHKEEMFETFKSMGWTAEMLKDPKDKKEYADWPKENERKPNGGGDA